MIAALVRDLLRQHGPMPGATTNTVVDCIRVGEALDLVAADATLEPEWDAADERTQDLAAEVMWDVAFQAIARGATVRETARVITIALRDVLQEEKDRVRPQV